MLPLSGEMTVSRAPMKSLGLSSAVMLVAISLACATAGAKGPQEDGVASANAALPTVAVTTMRNPVDKSYRKMIKGMDLFQQMHGLAPNASLRYKLLPRQPDTNMSGIQLNILGDSVVIPVTVAPDRTFTLERNQRALDEDASVIPDRRAQSMTWRTEIRTPGLPAEARRLGDLRLECHVGMEAGLVSDEAPIIGAIASQLHKMMGYCDRSEVRYLFFAERPLFGVTMVAGARRVILPVDSLYAGISNGSTSRADLAYCDCQALLDRTYFLPLGDLSWPDDTLIEFEYMEDESDPRSALGPAAPTLGETSR